MLRYAQTLHTIYSTNFSEKLVNQQSHNCLWNAGCHSRIIGRHARSVCHSREGGNPEPQLPGSHAPAWEPTWYAFLRWSMGTRNVKTVNSFILTQSRKDRKRQKKKTLATSRLCVRLYLFERTIFYDICLDFDASLFSMRLLLTFQTGSQLFRSVRCVAGCWLL